MDVKKLIMQTFIEIGNENGFDSITINKIVKECNISRTAFYYYYKDLPDVIDYYFGKKFSEVAKVCAGMKEMRKGVEYSAEHLIYNFPECRKLLKSKWRGLTEIYLHKHWLAFAEKMISTNRKGIPMKEEERTFLTRFISGGICDYIMHGNHQEISVQVYAEQFCLLLNARHALMEKTK